MAGGRGGSKLYEPIQVALQRLPVMILTWVRLQPAAMHLQTILPPSNHLTLQYMYSGFPLRSNFPSFPYPVHGKFRPDQIDSLLLGQNLTRVAPGNLISMTPYIATKHMQSCLHGKTSQQVKKLHSSSKKVAKLQGRWQTSRKVAKLQGR